MDHVSDANYALKQLRGIDANTVVGYVTYQRIRRAMDALERIVAVHPLDLPAMDIPCPCGDPACPYPGDCDAMVDDVVACPVGWDHL